LIQCSTPIFADLFSLFAPVGDNGWILLHNICSVERYLSDFFLHCVYHNGTCACYLAAQERSLNNRTKSIFRLLKPFDQSAPLGASASFSSLYEQTRLPVFRYLYGLTGGPQEDVEDLTAEAYTRAWRARRTFQGDPEAALGWLMKIARRLVIDDYRRRKVRPVTDGDVPLELPATELSPEEALLAVDEQKALWQLLRSLPDESRETLTLRYLLGWRVNQIAEFLEVPENNISAAIHRSLERLRAHWSAQERLASGQMEKDYESHD
jgi:RNA polymerase sigma-70 factor, ECF subfamily